MQEDHSYVQQFQRGVAAHPDAEEWEMRLIRDDSRPFSVWVIVVQGRRMRTYCGLLKDNSHSPLLSSALSGLLDCRYRPAHSQPANVWGAGCSSAWQRDLP